MDYDAVLAKRRAHIGPNTTLVYKRPLHMVRGEGCRLWDADGNEYLDCVNNVAHVGHCHPKVTAAIALQLATLNTNARYLHEGLSSYAEALTATFPEELSVAYFVNSGSEANDLALRIAHCAAPGATHVAIMGGAYHGHTKAVIDLSPYKYEGPGGEGRQPYVHVLPCPDPYRGQHLDGRKAAKAAIAQAHAAGGRICAFYCESVLSCGGQIILPEGYLREVYEEMHAEGAVCVADEVQCGFGRAGDHFWAFEEQGIVPDIVTLGKPIGNGFPLGAVIVQPKFAAAFSNGMEYFNTYGGCTAAGAAGMATLRVIQEENFQARAKRVGVYLTAKLKQLQQRFEFVGDVRGSGLMIGVEIVDNKDSKKPAPNAATHIKETMVARHVLLAVDGPHANVVKIKPPMVFAEAEADHLIAELTQVLEEGLPEGVIAADRQWEPRTPL
ncbi:PLP-dependent transferase [Coccomyxa subellipsoidea C-169]|uniref:PLP-dependent transferase n=1 Tax=Coccomyxa subellipsoidea (strain C-169) TaxID=574566 RepID=I0YXA9_COCSC|nr:PLP-dependent transferase [Coccomyxa subellipsoidea C-169]EIE23028.1 PLP-dependent transferase [Coccomyxa subellipsoidea C-169]|eukprot:XP_005647572.1 PLP-dependent transferase [Coccomyxa subellipsoidea C-169]